MAAPAEKKATLTGYVGFDSITSQIEKKLLKRGFNFNVMVVGMYSVIRVGICRFGRSGLGKSTLVNTIFASHLVDSKGLKKASDPPRQTTEIANVTHVERQLAQSIRDLIPFAVVGSERNIVVDGKAVRGRRTRWGLINVENEAHCEFVALRNFLTRTHLQDLIETTASVHYETFRTKQLLALKESTSISSPPNGSLRSG
ncbi:cell division control protein [Blyttiomyces sp. JEL0837]|nr:cell division control protein [Blyttiomyces sp. JEL0837]